MKVLLVDDEPAILELLSFAFSKKEIPVVTAGDAEAAVAILAAGDTFDAALVDKNLPGMNGLQLIAKIRETDVAMAVLMMTGYASPETATEALNLDVDAYLEKPFPTMTMVVDRVIAATEKRRALVASGAIRPPAATPAPDAPAAPARVLMVASAELEEALRSALLPHDEVYLARRETELNLVIAKPSDLVVIDAFLLGGEVVPVVERVQRTSPGAEFVVISDRALDLRTVQKLIELGVRRLCQSTSWGRPMRNALETIRKKKRA